MDNGAPASEHGPAESLTVPSSKNPFRAITHFAVLTAFVLPIVLLPYLLTRRQLSILRRRSDETDAITRILQQDLNKASSDIAVRKDEHRRIRVLLHDMMQETDELQQRAGQREIQQAALDESVRSDLRKLLDETQHSRTQAATLRALGTSLADIAAFIHEVELEMGMPNHGKDPRGVEKLRLLALRMQSLPQQNKLSGEPVTGPTEHDETTK